MMFNQIVQLLQGGANPNQVFNQIFQQNPGMKAGIPLIKNKTPEQLQQTFYNLCKERGIDPNQYAHQMGIRLPK